MPENTLRLALVQAKVSHANIKSVCTCEAEKMPGVFKIITAKDIVAAGGKNRINGLVMLPLNNKCDGWDRRCSAMRKFSSLEMRSPLWPPIPRPTPAPPQTRSRWR